LASLEERANELPTDSEIYFICKMGGRSLKAAEWAASKGHSATNVGGGTMAWVDAGLPTETG
jgi:rhodanese-related sulfurtransferase